MTPTPDVRPEKPETDPGSLAGRCWTAYLAIIGPVTARARELGYAIGRHGSVQRDIDLIAAPWSDEAVPAEELAEALRQTIEATVGAAYPDPLEVGNPYFEAGRPGAKPHGRLGWCWYLDPNGGVSGPYVDLSVMPRTDPPYPEMTTYRDPAVQA